MAFLHQLLGCLRLSMILYQTSILKKPQVLHAAVLSWTQISASTAP